MRKRKSAVLGAVILIIFAAWLGIRQYRNHVQCQLRIDALGQRIESFKNDAHNQMRIGTKKADVERFFGSHQMEATFGYGHAMGQINTTGCAPFGCGLDTFVIKVSVEVDSEGTVIAEPHVSGIYTDCL